MRSFALLFPPLAIAAAVGIARAGSDPGAVLLEANFNAEPLDQPIGTGGPEFGQPVSVFPGLSAIVRGAPMPTPSLEISESVGGSALPARFEFLGSEEVTHGDLTFRLRVEAAQLDTFDVRVREQGTAAQNFASLVFTNFGTLSASDNNGSLGTIGTYTAGVVIPLAFFFHLDDGTWDLSVDGSLLVSGRAHGVTTRGVGALIVGTGTLTTPGTFFYVDRLRVTRGDDVFGDGFD